ncbi:hypothetical protein BC937DRAFT_90389 [Endogone sp. FLAS-F59071]|nr:hypothetical protein BC937DRAFT_90389 [Endogone sp. FLAS-F59071]|eukprot:RUS17123.1 hypothetical protein BC937DRAFT_90389 [Endogone sp. FLAS-F59071]
MPQQTARQTTSPPATSPPATPPTTSPSPTSLATPAHSSIFLVSLPTEIVLLILSYLSQDTKALVLPLVSKLWRDLLYNTPDFCRYITIYNASSFVQHINSERFSHITILDGRASEFTDAHLLEILAHQHLGAYLADLDLSVCRELTDASIHLIGRHCPRLTHLAMEGCANLTDASPLSMLPLVHLNLAYCEILDSASIKSLVFSPIHRTLTKLDLNGCFRIDHRAITTIADYCIRLRFLSIDGQGITDNPVIHLISRLQSLQTFSISFANDLTDLTLQEIAPILPQFLAHLRLRKGFAFTSPAFSTFFSTLAARGHHFARLDLSECAGIDDAALASFKFPFLRYLNIEWCWNISDAGLHQILIASSPDLVALYCTGINDITLVPLLSAAGASPEFPCLHALKLESCRMVDRETICRVSVANPKCFIVDYYQEVMRAGKKVGVLNKEEVWAEEGLKMVTIEEQGAAGEVVEGMEEKEKEPTGGEVVREHEGGGAVEDTEKPEKKETTMSKTRSMVFA